MRAGPGATVPAPVRGGPVASSIQKDTIVWQADIRDSHLYFLLLVRARAGALATKSGRWVAWSSTVAQGHAGRGRRWGRSADPESVDYCIVDARPQNAPKNTILPAVLPANTLFLRLPPHFPSSGFATRPGHRRNTKKKEGPRMEHGCGRIGNDGAAAIGVPFCGKMSGTAAWPGERSKITLKAGPPAGKMTFLGCVSSPNTPQGRHQRPTGVREDVAPRKPGGGRQCHSGLPLLSSFPPTLTPQSRKIFPSPFPLPSHRARVAARDSRSASHASRAHHRCFQPGHGTANQAGFAQRRDVFLPALNGWKSLRARPCHPLFAG